MAIITKNKYLKGSIEVLEKSQKKQKKKYFTVVFGKKFIVYPNVFSPKYFEDAEIFIPKISVKKEERFLEIGPGTGVISVFVALRGAGKVFAIDINPDAVKNTKENARLHKVANKVTVLQGSIYGPLSKKEKFNTIFWNVPFGYTKSKKIKVLERAIADPGYKSIKKFFNNARNYLQPNGRLLIGFSTTIGDFNKLKEISKKASFKMKLLGKKKSFEKYPVWNELFEAKIINYKS